MTPEMTNEILDEILGYRDKISNLGGGIVQFHDVVEIDQLTLLPHLDQLAEESHTSRWEYTTDEDGHDIALNEDGYQFLLHEINEAPIPIRHPDTQLFKDALYKCALKYIDLFPVMMLETVWWRSEGHYLKYPTRSYLGKHSTNVQTISLQLLLNDDYSGGEMKYPYLDVAVEAKAGDVVVSPCNFVAAHEIKPITEGNRYSYLEFYSQGSPEKGIPMLSNIFNDYDKLLDRRNNLLAAYGMRHGLMNFGHSD